MPPALQFAITKAGFRLGLALLHESVSNSHINQVFSIHRQANHVFYFYDIKKATKELA